MVRLGSVTASTLNIEPMPPRPESVSRFSALSTSAEASGLALAISDAARASIQPVCDEAKLRQQALQDGLRPLRLAGAMKVAEGVTTLDEVLRATPAWE
jgi:hypothetical protein